MVVWVKVMLRSAIIWTRSRELELEGEIPSYAEHDDFLVRVPALCWDLALYVSQWRIITPFGMALQAL